MKELHYLRGCLILPIMVPLLVSPLIALRRDPGGVAEALVISLFVGGIPYLAFAGVSAVVLWRRSARSYWLYAWLSPIIFIPVYLLCFVSYEVLFDPPASAATLLIPVLIHSSVILAIGYGYVVVAWVAYRVLRWRSLIDDVA